MYRHRQIPNWPNLCALNNVFQFGELDVSTFEASRSSRTPARDDGRSRSRQLLRVAYRRMSKAIDYTFPDENSIRGEQLVDYRLNVGGHARDCI
jgi:hypothetical protein